MFVFVSVHVRMRLRGRRDGWGIAQCPNVCLFNRFESKKCFFFVLNVYCLEHTRRVGRGVGAMGAGSYESASETSDQTVAQCQDKLQQLLSITVCVFTGFLDQLQSHSPF